MYHAKPHGSEIHCQADDSWSVKGDKSGRLKDGKYTQEQESKEDGNFIRLSLDGNAISFSARSMSFEDGTVQISMTPVLEGRKSDSAVEWVIIMWPEE